MLALVAARVPSLLATSKEEERQTQGLLNLGEVACPDDDGYCSQDDKSKYAICYKGLVLVSGPRTRCTKSNVFWNLLKGLGMATCGCCSKDDEPNRPSYCGLFGTQEGSDATNSTAGNGGR